MGVEEGGTAEESAMPVRRSCFGVWTLVEAWGWFSPLSPPAGTPLPAPPCPAGEEETTVVSCVSTSLQTRILATPGDPADMSVSVPLGGPAVLDWGQLLLALFVLLVSLCIQVFLSKTSLTIQRRSGYRGVDPQPQQVNPFAPERNGVHLLPPASIVLLLSNRLTVWSKGRAEMLPRQAQLTG